MSDEARPMGEGVQPALSLPRRSFFGVLCVTVGAIGTALAGIPVAGFVFGPIFGKRPTAWRNLGPLDNFPVGQTVPVRFEAAASRSWAGVSAHMAAWLRHEPEGHLTAFSVNCTHLGCPVRWEPQANLFMCPCHGGVYYSDGRVAGGPPPKPLPHYPVRLHDGQVEILAEPVPLD